MYIYRINNNYRYYQKILRFYFNSTMESMWMFGLYTVYIFNNNNMVFKGCNIISK